jgi:hypothetical protein
MSKNAVVPSPVIPSPQSVPAAPTMQVFTAKKMQSRRTVILPDMFKGFVVESPPMNPNYETVKPISERWLAEYAGS